MIAKRIPLGKLPRDYKSLVKFHMPHAIRDCVAYANTMLVLDALTSLPERTADHARKLGKRFSVDAGLFV